MDMLQPARNAAEAALRLQGIYYPHAHGMVSRRTEQRLR